MWPALRALPVMTSTACPLVITISHNISPTFLVNADMLRASGRVEALICIPCDFLNIVSLILWQTRLTTEPQFHEGNYSTLGICYGSSFSTPSQTRESKALLRLSTGMRQG